MKKVTSHSVKIFSLITVVGALLSLGAWETVFATAGVSSKLSYQGRLTDTSGNPVANGTYYVCFAIYDSASAGTKLWPAGVPTNNAVTVTNGIFNAAAGVSDALTFDFSTYDTVYLNVGVSASNVVCDNGAMENLAPRQRVDATAYARVSAGVYGAELKTDTANNRVQVGVGGAGSGTPTVFFPDSKNTSDTVGAACGSGAYLNGAIWYNSNIGRMLTCSSNVIQVAGSAISNQFFNVTGPATAIRTFTFPNVDATVLTSNAAVTAAQGGTGQTTYTIGDLLYASASNALSKLIDVATGSYLRSGGAGAAPVWSTMTLPNAATTGDLLYASGSNVIGNLADVSAGSFLRSGGAGVAPAWSTATIPNTTAQGDLLYSSATNVISALTKDATATRYLSNTGASNSPAWAQVNLANGVTGNLATTSLNSGTGATATTYWRGDGTWATPAGGGTNALLDGTSHTDTTAGTVARGDIITGQTATPKWTRLAKGTADQVLAMDSSGVDVIWKTPAGGGGSPGGADTQLQFNNAGAFAGDADYTWASSTNDLTLGGVDTGITMKTITNEPAVPAAGTGHLYTKSIGGRVLPKFVGPSGIDFAIQPLMAQDKVALWNPPGNATTLPGVFGFTAPTTIITATARSVATTRFFTRVRRLGFVSAATAGLLTGHYNVAAGTQWTVGDGAGLGGFFYVARFGDSSAATVAGSREFVGMTSTVAAPTNVEPNTLLNSIGVGHGAADTNLKIFYGGSAAQTPIDLGANFPARTLSTDMYELVLFASPAVNNTVGYKVTRLNTGNVAEGTLTGTAGTALPASTTLLGHRAWITNNATALAVGIDIASVYISSDY